jgi:peptidoglycan hydrolase FlgJ
MIAAATTSDPRLAGLSGQSTATSAKSSLSTRMHAQAEDFESMFLSTMFQSMFTAIDGDGPLGSTTGVAPWRSFLTQEYGKSVAQKGGIGLAEPVYRELMARQEVRAK